MCLIQTCDVSPQGDLTTKALPLGKSLAYKEATKRTWEFLTVVALNSHGNGQRREIMKPIEHFAIVLAWPAAFCRHSYDSRGRVVCRAIYLGMPSWSKQVVWC